MCVPPSLRSPKQRVRRIKGPFFFYNIALARMEGAIFIWSSVANTAAIRDTGTLSEVGMGQTPQFGRAEHLRKGRHGRAASALEMLAGSLSPQQ